MSLVVPFDSSDLARTALVRAVQFDQVLGQGVVVVTAIPNNNDSYARERGWIEEDESFDAETVVSRIQKEVSEIAPEARFEYIVVSRYAQPGEIASKLRKEVRNNDASIVFIGSENAGRVVRSMSVGNTISSGKSYDTMLISHVAPSKIEEFEQEVPTEDVVE